MSSTKDSPLESVASAVTANRAALRAAEEAAADQREAIFRAVDGGASVAEIQRATGLSRKRVDEILKSRPSDGRAERLGRLLDAVRAASVRSRDARAATEETVERQRAAVKTAVDAGVTVTEIHRTTGLMRPNIYRALRERK
ncbi:hypothetical protein [Prescottella equi]|uniref:hypothetical protein n=1 Tax=Rhodococcus hoagii TaxID=43767 RepID=UPI00301D9541